MIQVRLWNDCSNNCSFCSLGKKPITKIEDKKVRLLKLSQLKDDKIGIIGGEFFEGQLRGCENEWLEMIKNISCSDLFITANLIYEPYLLKETLEIRPDILLCTSYDSVGRFKNQKLKEDWLARVNSLSNIFCTIIPTQDIINDSFIDKIQCGINLCEPHLGIDWLKNVDKKHYHDILIEENKIFNLPKRKDLLKWLLKHPFILENLKNYKATHFNTILSFDQNNNFIYESFDRFEDDNFMADCGHPYFSRCYADSDKCLICDVEEL